MAGNGQAAGGGNADAAIEAAARRAELTGHRNLPQFDDLPGRPDTANLREGPDLHPQCLPLLPLVGVWRGEGQAVYPTIDGPFHYRQQVTFAHAAVMLDSVRVTSSVKVSCAVRVRMLSTLSVHAQPLPAMPS